MRSPFSCVVVLRKSERKQRTSRAIRTTTPPVVDGFSIFDCLIQESDFCCPQVVGMRKGTGDRAQSSTFATTPTENTAAAA
jgi:hypothetical protein